MRIIDQIFSPVVIVATIVCVLGIVLFAISLMIRNKPRSKAITSVQAPPPVSPVKAEIADKVEEEAEKAEEKVEDVEAKEDEVKEQDFEMSEEKKPADDIADDEEPEEAEPAKPKKKN